MPSVPLEPQDTCQSGIGDTVSSVQVDRISLGDALTILMTLPENFIDMVMTSPPFWQLRDYGVAGQLGLEPTIEEYLTRLIEVFDQVRRVVKPTGSCWVNLGDTYAAGKQGRLSVRERIADKSLCLIPFRFATLMVHHHWILRNVIVWHKPNCLPASARDRFIVDFDYLFFFTKEKRYYFLPQYEPIALSTGERIRRAVSSTHKYAHGTPGQQSQGLFAPRAADPLRMVPFGRNRRAVWSISTRPFSDDHYAVYPEELCLTPIQTCCPEEVCVRCGMPRLPQLCPSEAYQAFLGKRWGNASSDKERGFGQGLRGAKKPRVLADYRLSGYIDCGCGAGFAPGVVLDPFSGSGTTAVVAQRLGRHYLGIELNPAYVQIAEKRLAQPSLFTANGPEPILQSAFFEQLSLRRQDAAEDEEDW